VLRRHLPAVSSCSVRRRAGETCEFSFVRGSVVLTWFYRGVTVGQVPRVSGVLRDDPRTTVFAGAPTTGVDDRGTSTKSARKSRIDVRGGDVGRVESRRAAVTSTTVHS
jgi:hypothetical protein